MNIQEKLLSEIERVVEVRSHYEELRRMPNVVVAPQIMMMTKAIDNAKKAAASGDAIEVMKSLKELEGWVD